MDIDTTKNMDIDAYQNFENFCKELESYQVNLKKINEFIQQIRDQSEKLNETVKKRPPDKILGEYGYHINEFQKNLRDIDKTIKDLTKRQGSIEQHINSFRDAVEKGNLFLEQLKKLDNTINHINSTSNDLSSIETLFDSLLEKDNSIEESIHGLSDLLDKIGERSKPLENLHAILSDEDLSAKTEKINIFSENESIIELFNKKYKTYKADINEIKKELKLLSNKNSVSDSQNNSQDIDINKLDDINETSKKILDILQKNGPFNDEKDKPIKINIHKEEINDLSENLSSDDDGSYEISMALDIYQKAKEEKDEHLYQKAAAYYIVAMDKGNYQAQQLLGNMFIHGEGVKKDVDYGIALKMESMTKEIQMLKDKLEASK